MYPEKVVPLHQRKGGGSHPLTLKAIVMNIRQLFQLETCLENLSANFMHTEIDYKTKLKNNFMKSKTFGFNDLEMEGSWIVIFAEDITEQSYIMNEIIMKVPDIKYSAFMFMDESEIGVYRIFIQVKEEE